MGLGAGCCSVGGSGAVRQLESRMCAVVMAVHPGLPGHTDGVFAVRGPHLCRGFTRQHPRHRSEGVHAVPPLRASRYHGCGAGVVDSRGALASLPLQRLPCCQSQRSNDGSGHMQLVYSAEHPHDSVVHLRCCGTLLGENEGISKKHARS